MIVLIQLFENGSSSIAEQHYIDAVSKEAALSSLVVDKGIDLDHYSLIIVSDLTKSIHKSTVDHNMISAVIDNDFNSPTLNLVKSYSYPSAFVDPNVRNFLETTTLTDAGDTIHSKVYFSKEKLDEIASEVFKSYCKPSTHQPKDFKQL